MKAITVKYRNGKLPLTSLKGVSAQMAEQLIKIIEPELRKFSGEYDFKFSGLSGRYSLLAFYKDQQGKSQYFTEAEGKTPSECLKNAYAVRHILKETYGWII